MAFNLQNYLPDQAPTLLRNTWGGGWGQVFSQEVYRILANIPRHVEVTGATDENGNPIIIESPTFPTLPPFPPIPDPDNPDNPFPQPTPPNPPPTPDNPNNPNNPQSPEPVPGPPGPEGPAGPSGGGQDKPHRNTFPGKVTGGSGDSYQVAIYMNGSSADRTVSASSVSGIAIPVGAWVSVYMVATYTQTITQSGGATAGDITNEVEYFILPPVGALAITEGTIAAQENNTPGSGTAKLRTYDGGSWGEGEEITVYNSSSSEVAEDTLIQVKQMYGLWFVDVEDCG